MRFFELLNFQHAIGSLLVPLIFLIIFGVGISFTPLFNSSGDKGEDDTHEFNDNIKEGNKPFPLIMALTISGTIAWAIFYILYYGLTEANI